MGTSTGQASGSISFGIGGPEAEIKRQIRLRATRVSRFPVADSSSPAGSERAPSKDRYLPFSQVPNTSRLFLDFLQGHSKVRPFYPRSSKFSAWFKDEASRISYEPARRERMANLLERQNRFWGSSHVTLQNIERLRNGACAVVTGQQVGLFGGPVFVLYKALSAIRLAQEATQAGVDCVPVFWLATQDHDLEEVNQVFIPGSDSQLNKISVLAEGTIGAPIANVKLGPDIEASLDTAAKLLDNAEGIALLRQTYRAGETFGAAFASLFAQLFAEWGLILLDASAPEINAIAAPIYAEAIERAPEFEKALSARGKELEAAGYHQQVKVIPSSTLVFTLKDGARTPIYRTSPSDFEVGGARIGKQELLERISTASQDFSPSALLRPVVQDFLLPTLAYAGGVSETAYFAQAAVIYQAIAGRVTPVVPHFSATILDSKSQALLQKYGMRLADVIQGPEAVREHLASRNMPQALQSAFDKADANLAISMANVSDLIGKLDETLVDASQRAISKIAYQIDSLRSRAGKAELRQNQLLARHAAVLSNLLFPASALQDRKIASIYFVARYGRQFLRDVLEAINFDHTDHRLLPLS